MTLASILWVRLRCWLANRLLEVADKLSGWPYCHLIDLKSPAPPGSGLFLSPASLNGWI